MNTKVYRSKYYWAKLLQQHEENRKKIIDIDINEYNQLHEYGLNDIPANNIIEYEASNKLPLVSYQNDRGIHSLAFNTSIKNHTFENGKGIIEFNDEVTMIDNYAFSGCAEVSNVGDLYKITLPNSIQSIGNNAFDYCSRLTSINIPEGVTHIGKYAFGECRALLELVIPSTIQTIGIYAFYTSAIKSLTIKSLTPPTIIVEDNHHLIYQSGGIQNRVIYVYNSVLETYLNDSEFQLYAIQPIQI